MARFKTTVESAAALGANTVFANIVAGSAAGAKIRRATIGCRAGATVPTSQQVSVSIVRATARGTATTTKTPQSMDPNLAASAITGVDTAWSVNPTVSSANPIGEVSFNTQSGVDLPWELIEEMVLALGTANGIAFENLANALPSGHLLTLDLEHEE